MARHGLAKTSHTGEEEGMAQTQSRFMGLGNLVAGKLEVFIATAPPPSNFPTHG